MRAKATAHTPKKPIETSAISRLSGLVSSMNTPAATKTSEPISVAHSMAALWVTACVDMLS
jgi:hypothetical protein